MPVENLCPTYFNVEAQEDGKSSPEVLVESLIDRAIRQDVFRFKKEGEKEGILLNFVNPNHKFFVIEIVVLPMRTRQDIADQEDFFKIHRHQRVLSQVYSFGNRYEALEFGQGINEDQSDKDMPCGAYVCYRNGKPVEP